MDKSGNLDSITKGNWAEENYFTKEFVDNFNLDIYDRVIKDYSRKLTSVVEQTKEAYTTDANDLVESKDSPELIFPEIRPTYDLINSRKYYRRVQNWKGIVLDIQEEKESFQAKLIDVSKGGTDEIAEFYIQDVSPSDLPLLKKGALFYWSVGNFMENGQSVNRSDLRFQRLVTLDEDDIADAMANVKDKYSNLNERKIDNSQTE